MRASGNIVARELSSKICAAFGAAWLVLGFALGLLMHPWATLAEVVTSWDHHWLEAWERTERSGVWLWLWTHAVMPLMVRPIWLVPTGMGLVFVGAAVTLAYGRKGSR